MATFSVIKRSALEGSLESMLNIIKKNIFLIGIALVDLNAFA